MQVQNHREDTHTVLAQAGIFDSGLGGLTVVRALRERAPSLPIFYMADTARFPYGERMAEEVEERVVAVGQSLVDRGCTILVVACNTASSAALDRLRAELPVPIVGMEPPLKHAVAESMTGKVIVLTTVGTAKGDRLARLEAEHAMGVMVHTVPMPGLADLIENGLVRDQRVFTMLDDATRGPVESGADAVALGCTHYGFIEVVLRSVLPDHVAVIDAAEAVARRTLAVLSEEGQLLTTGSPQPINYDVTGNRQDFSVAIGRLREMGEFLPDLVDIRALPIKEER